MSPEGNHADSSSVVLAMLAPASLDPTEGEFCGSAASGQMGGRAGCLQLHDLLRSRYWTSDPEGLIDPALTSGQAVVRDGRIVVASTNETIVLMEAAMREWLPEGRRICPECIGGYLSVREVTLPEEFVFGEIRNRAVPTKE